MNDLNCDADLKPCPFCGGTNIGFVLTKKAGVPSGDTGWEAYGGCADCHVRLRFWALEKDWAIDTFANAWNRRTP